MRPLVFLASYPRSGNTFLRAVLANYESGLDRPLTANEVTRFGFGEKNEPFWEACTGQTAVSRTLQTEWEGRAAYLQMAREKPGAGGLMFKTHTLNGVAFGAPAFHFHPDDRIVYIVRHPFDVTISAGHFFGIGAEAMAKRLILPGAFNSSGGYAPFDATGSWSENVSGWVTETRCPLLLVQYADLVADAGAQLMRVLTFLGKPIVPQQVRAAVKFSSFAELQKSEVDEGFDQGPARDRHASFFRSGVAGQWKTDLPPSTAQALDAELGPLMDVFGFERAPKPSFR